MNTLQNSCFQFQENDEAARECIRIMNERSRSGTLNYLFNGDVRRFYYVEDNQRMADDDCPKGRKQIPSSDYLLLLQSDQQKQLTVEDLLIENRLFMCVKEYKNSDGKTLFTKGLVYPMLKNRSMKEDLGRELTWLDIDRFNSHFVAADQTKIAVNLIKGNEFDCIKDFIWDNHTVLYRKGSVYKCEINGFLKNETGQIDSIGEPFLSEHFILHSQPEIVPVQEEEIVAEDFICVKGNYPTATIQQVKSIVSNRDIECYNGLCYNKYTCFKIDNGKEFIEGYTAHLQQQLKEAKELNDKLKDLFETAISYLVSANYHVSIQEEETLTAPNQESLADNISEFIKTNS